MNTVNAQGTGTGSPAPCQGHVERGQAGRGEAAQRAEQYAVVFREAGCGRGTGEHAVLFGQVTGWRDFHSSRGSV